MRGGYIEAPSIRTTAGVNSFACQFNWFRIDVHRARCIGAKEFFPYIIYRFLHLGLWQFLHLLNWFPEPVRKSRQQLWIYVGIAIWILESITKLLQVLAAVFLFQEFSKLIVAHGVIQKFPQIETPTFDTPQRYIFTTVSKVQDTR